MEPQHDELKDILSQTHEQLLTNKHIPIDTINILDKEVNDKKAERKKQLNNLQCLLYHVEVKTIHQRNLCNDNKETKKYPIKDAHDDTKLTNGINSSDTSLHSTFDCSSISSNTSPQKNKQVDPCPLRFDTLVYYFETGESKGQHEDNKDGFINQSKVFNAKNGNLHQFKNMKFSNKMQILFQKPWSVIFKIRMRGENHTGWPIRRSSADKIQHHLKLKQIQFQLDQKSSESKKMNLKDNPF